MLRTITVSIPQVSAMFSALPKSFPESSKSKLYCRGGCKFAAKVLPPTSGEPSVALANIGLRPDYFFCGRIIDSAWRRR